MIRLPLVVDPADDRDLVGHEAGDLALHEDVVAPNHVLILGLRRVLLLDNCKNTRENSKRYLNIVS